MMVAHTCHTPGIGAGSPQTTDALCARLPEPQQKLLARPAPRSPGNGFPGVPGTDSEQLRGQQAGVGLPSREWGASGESLGPLAGELTNRRGH